MMEAVSRTQRIYTPRYKHEDENFWKKHTSDFSDSGLSKTNYCKKNGINYARFFYWIKKLSPSQVQQVKNKSCFDNPLKKEMLPVQLKQPQSALNETKSLLHCTLNLKNGCTLHIHDEPSLLFIVDKWS